MIKLLALVHAGMSSHTVRVVSVAKALRDSGRCDVLFSGQGPWMSLVQDAGFEAIETSLISKQELYDRLHGRVVSVVYDKSNLEHYFDIESRLLEATKPDIILRDHFRELAGIAAKRPASRVYDVFIQKVPLSPYYHFDFRPDDLPAMFDKIPAWILRPLGRRVENYYRHLNARHLRDKVRELNLDDWLSVDGVRPDLTLFPDSEYLFDLPAHEIRDCHFLGPILPEKPVQRPDWFDKFISDPRKKILITRGTTGEHEETRFFARVFPHSNYAVALHSPEPVRITNFYGRGPFDIEAVLPHCDLFITHGGTGSTYTGIKNRVPMLILYDHFEQQINAVECVRRGIALTLRKKERSVENIHTQVRRLLSETHFKRSITDLSARIFSEDPLRRAEKLITEGYESWRRDANSVRNPASESSPARA